MKVKPHRWSSGHMDTQWAGDGWVWVMCRTFDTKRETSVDLVLSPQDARDLMNEIKRALAHAKQHPVEPK